MVFSIYNSTFSDCAQDFTQWAEFLDNFGGDMYAGDHILVSY